MVLIRNRQRLIPINLYRIKRDSLRLLRSLNLQEAEISILLVNDVRMRKLNNSSRGIDRTTDVLSFPQQEREVLETRMGQGRRRGKGAMFGAIPPPVLLGDVVINLHAAQRQAARYGNTFQEEVRRLLIHGLLHLLGYDHERSDYEERTMRKKEIDLHHALETMDKER